jgi:FkbM family methyltransferase
VRKLYSILGRGAWRRGLAYGVAASVEHERYLASHEVATLIDAGANKGQFSLALKCFWPLARIIAFEPLSGPASRFERLFRGDARVALRRVALGSSPGDAEIHVSRKSDSSSLLPPGKLQEEIFPGTGEIGTEAVHVVRLDDAIGVAELPRPILFKIDVQGLELDVLKGAEASLGGIDHLYVEVSFVPLYTGQAVAHEIVDWLAQRGFRLSGIYHVEFDRSGRSVQADMHFQPAR